MFPNALMYKYCFRHYLVSFTVFLISVLFIYLFNCFSVLSCTTWIMFVIVFCDHSARLVCTILSIFFFFFCLIKLILVTVSFILCFVANNWLVIKLSCRVDSLLNGCDQINFQFNAF